ncbi:MAG: L-threonylcarbamoyladenylate synthase [Planctomycetaceae bacterium]
MAAATGTDVSLAGRLLREGGLVAFGTETVYGLGANALDALAVARVFEAKNRPHFDPLIVHLADRGRVGDVAATFPPIASQLADAFWPGPLTLVLPKRSVVPDLVTSGRSTVAVRVPAPETTRSLLAEAGVPVAAPSANPFGRISPTTAAHVAEQLGDEVDYIFDCGPCAVGIESTVVDLTGSVPILLRPGGVTLESLQEAVGRVEQLTNASDGPQRAPGMLSRHYSPRTRLVIAQDPAPVTGRAGLLAFHPDVSTTGFDRVEVLSITGDLAEAAVNFFAALRRLDAANLDLIVATPFPEVGLGRALNDRLRRAAAAESSERL